MKELSLMDFFFGAGGLSEGFIPAGFKSIAHVEIQNLLSLKEHLIKYFYIEYRITYIDTLLSCNFPKDFIPNQKNEIKCKFKFIFRLLDGDRNIYFESLATRNDSFDPLDFF